MNTTRATGIGTGIQPCMWGTIGVGALTGAGAGLTARWRRFAPPGGAESIQGRRRWR